MKTRKIITGIIGILFGIGYIFFSSSIQTTEYIWILTRTFGMISILSLFIVVFLGELKLLGISRFIKFHHLLGITTFYLVFLHFVSAIFEKYQWGINLSFVDYLGVNYSDKWMIFLSIGSLAFYLMILISVTSAYSVMAKIGYRRWRLTHYLTYLTLLFAFAHSIILGTDYNHSSLKTIFLPVTMFIFSVLLCLLAFRIGKIKFNISNKIAVFLLMTLIMSGGIAYAGTRLKIYSENVGLLKNQMRSMPSRFEDMEKINLNLTDLISKEESQINDFKKMSESVSAMISRIRKAAEAKALEEQAAPTQTFQFVPPPEEITPIPAPVIEDTDRDEDNENEYEREDDD